MSESPDLPPGMRLVRTTPEFDEETLPAGLRATHKIAKGVWGNVVVRTGSVDFVFDDDPSTRCTLETGGSQPIPPERVHHLIVTGPVSLAIEFYAE
mgnify:CR=1 FL=1